MVRESLEAHNQSAANSYEVRSFHEAAHAVAAIDLMMVGVTARIGANASSRSVRTDGDTTFGCAALFDELPERTLQRRLVVILAGPEWELFASVQSTRRQILREQRDDRIAVLQVIKQLRRLCGLRGGTLKECVEDAWNEARSIRERRSDHINKIAVTLQESRMLDDSQLRLLFAQSSFDQSSVQTGETSSS